MVSHQNLLTNTHICLERSRATSGSSVVSWLPHYHDMGLVGAIPVPLCGGYEQTLMSPADFLRRPLSWLEAVSQHRADVIIAPNFAYELCAQKLMTEASPSRFQDMDLSCLRVAFVGAEMVHAATLARFAAAAAPFGFSAEVFLPCYGSPNRRSSSTAFMDLFRRFHVSSPRAASRRATCCQKAAANRNKPIACWWLPESGRPLKPAMSLSLTPIRARNCPTAGLGSSH
jgi:acyl-CoA synthetase (AMP-forming)/AMP-acid ligase II